MAKEDERARRSLAGYDRHLGCDWPEWGQWVYHLDAEHMARFRAELVRLLPGRPDVVELLCREPRWRQEWAKTLSPELRARLESIPEEGDDEFPVGTVEAVFVRR